MGHVSFNGLSLLTAPGRVMTPRPATEQLVAAALERLGERPARVVEVGTGSGALAIAIAAAAPRAQVWATDTSRCAVALARANVRRHGLDDRIIVRHGDLLESVPGPIELIVANLPYLPASAAASHPELAAEPGAAVFAGGDGLGPYRRLIDAGAERLTADGAVVIQLHGRVLAANRNELAALRAALASQAHLRLRTATISRRRGGRMTVLTTRRYTPQPVRFARLRADEARQRSEDFLALMRRRRSVRHFSSEPVTHELIENAIRTAATAPSGANQQPWTFVVVSDPAVKLQIRAAAEREEELLYRERASQEYLQAIEPIGTDWIKPHITDAPYLIVVFEQAWGRDEMGDKKKHYYVRESVGIAVGFLLAALHNAGLATLTHAPSPMGFVKNILDRPDSERPFLLIPVGYPAPDADVPSLEKKSLAEIAKFI